MQKVLIAVFACLAMIGVSFAEESRAVKKDFELRASAGNITVGNLKAVLPSDLSRPETGLVVTDGDGKDVSFTVKPLAVVYSALDGTLMSISDVPPGERVQVSYQATPKGKLQATSVKVLGKGVEEETRAVSQKQEEEAIK